MAVGYPTRFGFLILDQNNIIVSCMFRGTRLTIIFALQGLRAPVTGNLGSWQSFMSTFPVVMSDRDTVNRPVVGESYIKRLKKEAFAGRILDLISMLTPRIRRRNSQSPQRIGVLCQWGIGDAVLLLPLLRSLRRHFPNASIELIGKPWLGELFADEACCDRTHVLVPPWTAYARKYRQPLSKIIDYLRQIKTLRRQNFDWLISARFDPREILQLRLLRATMTVGFRQAGGRHWITYDLGISRLDHDSAHRADVAKSISRKLCGVSDDSDTWLLQSIDRQIAARGWLKDQGYKSGVVMAIHTGAGHPNRRWREPNFDSVLRDLKVKPSFVVFIEDRGNSYTPWGGPMPHVHWTGDLSDLKALLSVCDLFLGNDSGVMHMASAAGCKVIAIFGSAEPHWFGPVNTSRSVVIIEPMQCRPCFDACIHSTVICMERISHETVMNAVEKELTSLLKPKLEFVSDVSASPTLGMADQQR